MNKKELGVIGEKYAADYLKSKKYEILQLNYSCPYGEIDIIAKHKNSIVFVEVKTRKSIKFGKGMEAVNFYKQQKLKKVALYYLNTHTPFFSNIRFDVIDILVHSAVDIKIEHIENAF